MTYPIDSIMGLVCALPHAVRRQGLQVGDCERGPDCVRAEQVMATQLETHVG
jgi:hypothetical protein